MAWVHGPLPPYLDKALIMVRTSDTTGTLPIRVDRDAALTLPAQISGRIRELVLSGRLSSGDRLPASRRLAAELALSRAVAEQAYAQLVAEGWLVGRHGSGTFVAPTTPLAPEPRRPPVRRPARRPAAPDAEVVRLDTGTPWVDARHAAAWRRAWREVSAATPPRGYDDPRGLPELRSAIADRLGRTRGIDVDPAEVLVTAGTVDGLRHLLGVLPDGAVAIEDPGYRAAVALVRDHRRTVVDLPAGDPVTDLSTVVAAYVTPAHQHPLGTVMSAADRASLLDAARRAGALVVEDDYDSEFRYDVAPIPALAALDRDRVGYLGTTSKTVAPSLRLGWLVPPPDLLGPLCARRALTHDAASLPTQRAMVTLLRDGYVDAAVRAARRTYADRAARVAAALGPLGELRAPVAGMYATLLLSAERTDRARAAARRAGFDLPRLADYCRAAELTGLVVGFGGCTDDELDRALAVLVGVLG